MVSVSDLKAIAAIAILPVAALATYANLLTLTGYNGLLVLVLAAYGITVGIQLKRIRSADLFPGIVSDMVLVGFSGLLSSFGLYIFGIMPQTEFLVILAAILSALGIARLGR